MTTSDLQRYQPLQYSLRDTLRLLGGSLAVLFVGLLAASYPSVAVGVAAAVLAAVAAGRLLGGLGNDRTRRDRDGPGDGQVEPSPRL